MSDIVQLYLAPKRRISPVFFLVTSIGEHHFVGSVMGRITLFCSIHFNSARTGSRAAGGGGAQEHFLQEQYCQWVLYTQTQYSILRVL